MASGDVLWVYGSPTALTVTALHSLASSATAGWQSAAIDLNALNCEDLLLQVILDFANTAPANSKGIYVFLAEGLSTSNLTNPASVSEGTITLLDVTANSQNLKVLGFIPYTTADEVVESRVFSVAAVCGGVLPAAGAIVLINHSGAALAASGNSVTYQAVYRNITP
jgi:hypothetical protein